MPASLRKLPPAAALAASLLLLGGCQQFFTTSLASPLAQSYAPIPSLDAATAAVLADRLAQSPDQELAVSALPALGDLVAANSSDPSILADASLVAVVATGLDTALTRAVASIDITAILSGGALADAQVQTLADLVGGAVANVDADARAIFTALAAEAASDPAALASAGLSAQTLAVAATALALADVTDQLAPGQTLADVISGSVTYTPSPGLSQTLADLSAGAQALDPANGLLAMLQTTLNIGF